MGFGIRSRPTTPLLSPKRMKELGIARASMPRMMSAAALAGMKAALLLLKHSIETGELVDRPDLLVSMEEITALVGYERINKLEQELTTEEELLRKYGNKRRDYVIHDHAEVAP